MQKYGVNELRRMFLEFFESKDHLAMKSFSLVPHTSYKCRYGSLKALFYRPGDPAQAQGMYLPEVYPYRRYREYRKDRPPRHLL